MTIIDTPNGFRGVEQVSKLEDFEQVLENNVSVTAARVYREMLQGIGVGVEKPKGDDFERIADGLQTAVVDLHNELEALVVKIQSGKKMTKDDICNRLGDIIQDAENYY